MELREDIVATVDKVRAAYDVALHAAESWTWGSTLLALVPGEQEPERLKRTISGALRNTYFPAINKWIGRGRALRNGQPTQRDLDAWRNEGKNLLINLRDNAGYAGDVELGRLIADTVTQSARDVGEAATQAASFVADWWKPAAIAVVVLVAVIVAVRVS